MARNPTGVNVIFLLLLPSAYIFAALVALFQFQVIFTLLQQVLARVKTVPALESFAPFAGRVTDHLIKVFGQPHKFVPQATHVFLVALIIAVIVHLERSRR